MRLARMPAGILRRFTAIEYGRRPSGCCRGLPGKERAIGQEIFAVCPRK